MKIDFEVIYQASVKYQTTDVLSWLPNTGTDYKDVDHEIAELAVQHHTCNENTKTTSGYHDCENPIISFDTHYIMKSRTDDVELPKIFEFIQASREKGFCDQMLLRFGDNDWWGV